MKKNLALILVFIMIVGSLFGVIPMAEGESVDSADDGRYIPEIAYANVNYTNNIYMMFAVAAPAELAENESVKLLVWESRDDSIAFSYNDAVKEVIEADADPVTIGDTSYLVFRYAELDVTDMTNVICARAVLVKDGVATSYGKLIDYSIREYVESAKGNIDGIEPIADEKIIETLDDMLYFGSLAQQFSGDSYSFLANEEVKSIYVTTVLNGVEKDRSFAGFFAHGEGEQITIRAPFIDGTTIEKITGADGVAFEDLDSYTEGVQIETVDSNLEVTVYYKNAVARSFNADVFGEGVDVNNASTEFAAGANNLIKHGSLAKVDFTGYGSANLSGDACTFDSYDRMNYWHGIKTVASPVEGDDGVVFQFTATNAPCIDFNKITATDFAGVGFGDTIYPAFTFEITLGMVDGKMPASVGSYYFRHRLKGTDANNVDSQKWTNLYIFTIKNNKIVIYDGDKNESNNVVVGEIPTTGMRKFAITLDAITGNIVCFAENLETGVMEKTGETQIYLDKTFLGRQAAYLSDPEAYTALACYENIYTYFTKSGKLDATFNFGAGSDVQPAFENASIEIDGVETPIKTVNEDGSVHYNMDAVRALAERDYSFLMDDFNIVMGFSYQ